MPAMPPPDQPAPEAVPVDSDYLEDDQPGVLRVFQSKAETRAFYDKISQVYDLLAERSEAPMRRLGLEQLGVRPGETVLEIGFGTGHCLVDLARATGAAGHVLGVDLSGEMARLARQHVAAADAAGQVDLVCGDAEWLPWRNELIDAVFMSFTLELFDTPAMSTVLAECRRVLRPGGRLVVVGLSKDGPPGLVMEAFQWTHQHFPNLLDCRPIYVARACAGANLQVKEVLHRRMWVPVEIVLAAKA
jgi:demethylmenaquinone methyltransferase/2-methoxy-6-polyprenyl-1,4-benzoquinol methylase